MCIFRWLCRPAEVWEGNTVLRAGWGAGKMLHVPTALSVPSCKYLEHVVWSLDAHLLLHGRGWAGSEREARSDGWQVARCCSWCMPGKHSRPLSGMIADLK